MGEGIFFALQVHGPITGGGGGGVGRVLLTGKLMEAIYSRYWYSKVLRFIVIETL